MLNNVTMMGRLTRDPELRKTSSGNAVTSFSIACDRDFADQSGEKTADFFDVVAWRAKAEFIVKYFKKGSMIAITGRLQNRKWTDNNGNTRYATEIVADNAYFGSSKKAESSETSTGQNYSNQNDVAVEDVEDDDFPF